MWGRVLDVFRRRRLDADLEAQLAYHLDGLEEEYRSRGLNPDDARAAARRAVGGITQVRDAYRDQHGIPVLETLTRNVRLAVRGLRRTPGLTATVGVTLALGIGANTAVFSTLDAILLRPLPYRDADRLVRIHEVRGAREFLAGMARLEDWNRLSTTFEAISGYTVSDGSDTTKDPPERTQYSSVAPRFFEVLGIPPALGRTFTTDEHRFGTPTPVVISDRFWRSTFRADPSVLGQSLRIRDVTGDLSFTVAGVMPESFLFLTRGVQAWSAGKIDAPWLRSRQAAMSFWNAVGRLKPGVTLDQARADLARVQAQLAVDYPDTDRDLGVRVTPLKELVVGDVGSSLWLLFGAVTLLLLIACTNIAALLVARGAQREHEVALRFALGGTRAAVACQLLTEAALLAASGAAAGLAVASAAPAVIGRLAPNLPRLDEITVDARMLMYTLGATVLVALACGLVPALRSTRRTTAFRSAGTRVLPRSSLQWLLVGVQVTLSVILLSGAGLLLRSFDALTRVDAGFDPSRVLAFRVHASWGAERPEQILQRVNRTLDALATIPDVEVAATTLDLPGVPGAPQPPYEFSIEGRSDRPAYTAIARPVSPGYFTALRVPVLAGAICRRPDDQAGRLSTGEVMVNRSFADRYLGERGGIGLQLSRTNITARIAGIVDDARELGIDRGPVPTIYACDSAPNPTPWYLVRVRGEPSSMAALIRSRMKEIEPLRAVYDIAPLESLIGDGYAQMRLRTVLLTLFAGTALALTCVGVYGTVSYVVRLRRREVGVRLALGAARGGILRHFLGQGLRVALAASASGVVLSLVFNRTLAGMLFGVTPFDLTTLSSVVGLVLLLAAAAALLPAARAALAEPARILRED